MKWTILLGVAGLALAACAHHAPREGEPQDWRGRSALWQAVLMEHAKTGYFDMPARGGNSELSDEVVNAAAEYMLELTFESRPED